MGSHYGVTPALVLFWPYVALTGHFLLQKNAVLVSCIVGFLVSIALLCALWRRYFAEINVAVVAAGALALGLVTCTPSLVARCDVWEVPISCGYALTMLALAAIWKALHESRKRSGWLTAASLAYGLAVGARPSLLFGAVILLVPVAQAWRERRTVLAPLLAAVVPIALIGLGLMFYNVLRFDNPFEFGWHYVLSGARRRLFNVRYLWFNFRIYFLALAGWSGRFPFVHEIAVPRLPAGYDMVENPYGILTSIPVVWLALAVPLVWRSRSGQAWSVLRWFVIAVALLFGFCALPLGLYATATVRFKVDFLPALVLLAVVGILGLERTLTPTSGAGLAGRPLWRCAIRCGWGLLLGFSVAFGLLASVEQCAKAHRNFGVVLSAQGRLPEAIGQYERALQLNPDYGEAHCKLGIALLREDKVQEAIGHYERALQLNPYDLEAHNNLGFALVQLGRVEEAISHWEQALRIKPDYVEAHYNLGAALEKVGRVPEAIQHYQQALRIKPGLTPAQNALARLQAGQ